MVVVTYIQLLPEPKRRWKMHISRCGVRMCPQVFVLHEIEVDIVPAINYRDSVNMSFETDVIEAPDQKRLMLRGQKTLERILQKAGSAGVGALQSSTNEIGFMIEAARLAIESLGISADVVEKKLLEARLRGLARIAQLRKEAEPCLETGQVCELLGVTRETVRKKVDRKQLLALPKGGDRVFPAFQFKEGDIVAGLDAVLGAINTDSPFVALSFLLSKSPCFDGKTAIGALLAGKPEAVVVEAQVFLKHGG